MKKALGPVHLVNSQKQSRNTQTEDAQVNNGTHDFVSSRLPGEN